MARSYTTVFFDLDGTLLPMDTDVFMKRYFKALGAFAAVLMILTTLWP